VLLRHIRDKQPPEVIAAARKQHGRKTGDENSAAVDKTLIESFVRDARKAVAVLGELFGQDGLKNSEDDLRKFIICVHGIKSSLANIGENGLSKVAYELETAGREKNTDVIADSAPEFADDLRGLTDRLAASLESDVEGFGEGDDEDIGELRAKLSEIGVMCADYNRKGALDILAGLRPGCAETAALLEKLKEHVMQSDFEDAGEVVRAYLESKL
jgi:HPt (histidine-containing phosphotransfer) domain-containing protein